MRKPLFAFFLLTCSLCACAGEDVPPDPLASREGFCKSWAEAACQEKVVEYCNATSREDCVDTQSDFCLGILPENYKSSDRAKECLKQVKAAYADADLSAEELQVVRKLAAPCDQLSEGSRGEGQSCGQNDECDTTRGFSCVIKQGAEEGTCQKPELVAPGDTCDADQQICEDGYFCNGENCVAYKKEGGSCEGDYQCSPDDRCVIETEGEPGQCTARLEAGEECSSDSDCQSQYCAQRSDSSYECAQVIRLSLNEPLCEELQ